MHSYMHPVVQFVATQPFLAKDLAAITGGCRLFRIVVATMHMHAVPKRVSSTVIYI